jgi:hypothetical protein
MVVPWYANTAHITGYGTQHFYTCSNRTFHNVVDAQDGSDGNRTGRGIVAEFYMPWFPRANLFILAEAEAVSVWSGKRGLVHIAWNEFSEVPDGQPQCTAYGGVGPESGAEASGVTIDVKFFSDRSVDYQHLACTAGCDGVARQIELIPKSGFHGCDNYREMPRKAAGKDSVNSQFF